MQETHRVPNATRPIISGMRLVSEIPHDKYGSTVFMRSYCICENTSTSCINNIEIVQVNGITVTRYYKPPNERFELVLTSTSIKIVIPPTQTPHRHHTHRVTKDYTQSTTQTPSTQPNTTHNSIVQTESTYQSTNNTP